MIIDNPKSISWNVKIHPAGGRAITKQTEAIKVLSIAYNLILDSNQNRINKIKDFGTEQIKPILLKAYEWARNVKFAQVETPEIDEVGTEWVTALVNDPWYNAIYDMASISKPKIHLICCVI
jgi:hypothetical protein